MKARRVATSRMLLLYKDCYCNLDYQRFKTIELIKFMMPTAACEGLRSMRVIRVIKLRIMIGR